MELRDFFTDKEIKAMQEKIIKEASLTAFLEEDNGLYSDGDTYSRCNIAPKIEAAIRDVTTVEVRSHVKSVVEEVAKERVAAAVERFTQNLCDQLDKITEKTNWYWSIKNDCP